jgi:hypothetical protein
MVWFRQSLYDFNRTGTGEDGGGPEREWGNRNVQVIVTMLDSCVSLLA